MSDILTILPLTTLIVLAILTRKMGESMIAATLLAMLILHRGNFVLGTLDSFFQALSDYSFQFCMVFLISFGAVMKLFQESGGLTGLGNYVRRFVHGPRSAMLLSWLMDMILFMDEYMNSLTVTFSMRNITDKSGVPREHLAFHSNTMATSLCIAVPMTSWTAFSMNLIASNGMEATDYFRAVPMMFYPILMILLCLLLAAGLFPKLGVLKKAYDRTSSGGPALIREESENSLVDLGELDEDNVSSPLNILVPLAVIIGGTVFFDLNILAGIIAGLICQFVIYLPQKIMSLEDFFKHFFAGASSMLTILIILFFGFVLNNANSELGLYDLIIQLAGASVPAWLLPAVTFITTGFLVFSTGSCWTIMLLSIPIFIPLSAEMGVDPVLTLASLMSGVGLGYSMCFYGDTIFLSAAGSEVGNMTIVKTTLPYAIILALMTVAGYVALGLNM